MLYKLSNLNSNFALTLGYLNPALNNSALTCAHSSGGLAQTVERALACRAKGQGFDSRGRTNAQGLKSN